MTKRKIYFRRSKGLNEKMRREWGKRNTGLLGNIEDKNSKMKGELSFEERRKII
ncbi:MAG: hypothetical protein QUS12_12525 [Methanosarcina sp.]|nr:hypothetical protein [Methanosarcina sp.]